MLIVCIVEMWDVDAMGSVDDASSGGACRQVVRIRNQGNMRTLTHAGTHGMN